MSDRRIDVIYVAFNRLEFTRASFGALVDNTDWSLVRELHVYDDASTDGTAEYLEAQCGYFAGCVEGLRVAFHGERFGGPVAAMKQYLSLKRKPEFFAKVDNDFVMPPGWLNDLFLVMDIAGPKLDILGTEPFVGLDTTPEVITSNGGGYTLCSHIGGKGLLRTRAFRNRPLQPHGMNGYFGFTEWQHKNEDVTKAWITPDIKSFGLDQLPLESWRSLTTEYVEQGWQRRWPEYNPASHDYWDWWLNNT